MENKAKKLSLKEWFNSATMFYVNPEFESRIEEEVKAKTSMMLESLASIKDKDSLKKYINTESNALDYLVPLLGLSEEQFKRIVSMIRKERGYQFGSEWSLQKVRKEMISSPSIMERVLNLIWNGRDDEWLKERLPFFYLDNVSFGKNILRDLLDKDNIRKIVKESLKGSYSAKIGAAVIDEVEKVLKKVCSKYGLEYQKGVRIPTLDETVNFVVETPLNPKLVLNISYSVTTSSTQSNKKDTAKKIREKIELAKGNGINILFVNFLDGAGWVGRQADLDEIICKSDYVLNLKNIELLEDIIDSHINNF